MNGTFDNLRVPFNELNENVSRGTSKKKEAKDLFVQEQETLLRERLGTTVQLKNQRKKGRSRLLFFLKKT